MSAVLSKIQTSPHSPLLTLPTEIRTTINHHTFDSMSSYHIVPYTRVLEPTALFQVCSRIRTEANREYLTWLNARLAEIASKPLRLVPKVRRNEAPKSKTVEALLQTWILQPWPTLSRENCGILGCGECERRKWLIEHLELRTRRRMEDGVV